MRRRNQCLIDEPRGLSRLRRERWVDAHVLMNRLPGNQVEGKRGHDRTAKLFVAAPASWWGARCAARWPVRVRAVRSFCFSACPPVLTHGPCMGGVDARGGFTSRIVFGLRCGAAAGRGFAGWPLCID